MNLGRHKWRLAGVAVVVATALLAVGCSSSSTPASSSGTPVKGGTVTWALPPSTTNNWIFPFYAITNASVYYGQLFLWLLYRPL